MFKSKSFRLISEEEAKKQREKPQEPHKCQWMKYLILPALFGFMLLLILTNVDFTGEAYATTTAATITSTTNESQRFKGILKMNNASYNRFIDERTLSCSDFLITCNGGTIQNLYDKIKTHVKQCEDPLGVTMNNCTFKNGRMDATFFDGNYRLKSFTISDCNLAEFEANVFKQASVTDLTNMTFIKTNINSLNKLTFLGLDSLEYFTMINNKISTTFNGDGFLEPISDTITEVAVQQLSDNNKKYDPTIWLKSKRDQTKLLTMDLSGNIFHDTLTSVTFADLVQVQRLILSNSYITTIEIGTFNKIIKTLSYLDLSINQLTTLSGDFLATNSVTGFHMELHDNAWNCDCANYELVKFIKKSEIELTVAPKCSTPDELKDVTIKLITIECDDETTTAEPLPPSTTEAAKTTTKTTQTTMSTKTTEHTPTEPDVTYESDQPINTSEPVEITSKTAEPTTTETQKTTEKLETTEFTAPTDESGVTTQYTESDSTDESDQTDETSITSEPLETTSKTTLTESTTPYTTNTIWTTDIGTQTTSTTHVPIPPSKNYLIKCETGEIKNPTAYAALNKYDQYFSIEPISSTCVQLNRDNADTLNLIYFMPKAEYMNISNIDSSEFIEDLTPNADYVFCLISYGKAEISPFNCRSQHLMASPKEAWLLHSDMALFISLSVLGVAICLTCGIVVIYWTLRWRPIWLKGNKRLKKFSSKPNVVFLLPKHEVERHSAGQGYIFSEYARMHPSMSDTVSTPLDCLDKDYSNYMEFNKNLQLSRHKRAQYFPEYLPPFDYAATIASSNRQAFQCSSTQTTKYREAQSKNDEYESVNFYDEIR